MEDSENEAVLKDAFGNEVSLDTLSENDVVSIIKTTKLYHFIFLE